MNKALLGKMLLLLVFVLPAALAQVNVNVGLLLPPIAFPGAAPAGDNTADQCLRCSRCQ